MDLFYCADNRANLYNFPGAERTQGDKQYACGKVESDPCSARPMAKPAAPITAIIEEVSIPTRPRAATAVKAIVM